MRGIAALLVVLYHTHHGPFTRGYLAVDFFFLLSGFVLMHVYGETFSHSLRPTGKYLWYRLCRIYPAHALVTLSLLPRLGSGTGYSLSDLVSCLLLSQVWLPYLAFNDLAWTVSAEWFAYLGFPLIAWGASRTRRTGIIAAAAIAAGFYIAGCAGVFDGQWSLTVGRTFGRTFPEFVAGMLLYHCYSAGWWARLWRSDWAFLVVATAVILAAALGAPDGVIVAVLALLLMCAARNAGWVAKALNTAPLYRLGEASYSVYLAQAFVLIICGATLATPIAAALGLQGLQIVMVVGTIAAGLLLHRCVERPCRTAMRDWPQALQRLWRNRRRSETVVAG